MNSKQNKDRIKEANLNSQSILPRQGWQDKQAFVKAVIKAKRALDIAEINNLLS
jgi:hypothetical protein